MKDKKDFKSFIQATLIGLFFICLGFIAKRIQKYLRENKAKVATS